MIHSLIDGVKDIDVSNGFIDSIVDIEVIFFDEISDLHVGSSGGDDGDVGEFHLKTFFN